jgi:P27 family predicted phage terminase small subunit
VTAQPVSAHACKTEKQKLARPRTPTALKVIKGTAQKCRINAREPKPDPGMPRPPEHLSERARTAWPKISRMLHSMHVLGKTDGLVLEGLCETYAELIEARLTLRQRGGLSYSTEKEAPADLAITTVGGQVADINAVPHVKVMWRPYPEVAMIADLDRRFAMWLAKVGLTPADRSRVTALGGEEEKDPWSKFA